MRRKKFMRRRSLVTALCTSTLLMGLVVLSPSHYVQARAVGVFATVTAIDASRGIATLTTDAGEVYPLMKDSRWQVGTRVECERVEDAAQLRLQHCLVWQ